MKVLIAVNQILQILGMFTQLHKKRKIWLYFVKSFDFCACTLNCTKNEGFDCTLSNPSNFVHVHSLNCIKNERFDCTLSNPLIFVHVHSIAQQMKVLILLCQILLISVHVHPIAQKMKVLILLYQILRISCIYTQLQKKVLIALCQIL